MSDFFHVGLTVRDIERSYAFYSQVVGMRVWDQDADLGTTRALESYSETSSKGPVLIGVRSDAFDKLTNAQGAEIKYLMLKSADGALAFQLIEYVKGRQGELELGHARCGSMHFSFLVDDVEAKYSELSARGDVQITSEIVQISPNMRSFYTMDPDGVPVEFMELTR
jgi:catechol 2,3-dioxygenase-like lactoylglutathione lyase family enzyme